jgi:hypothetical protein
MAGDVIEIQAIPLSVTEEDVFRCLGSPGRILPDLVDDVAQAIAAGRELLSPRALYRHLAVERVGSDGVSFAEGISLEGKFLAHLFEGAEEAVFLVVTIGAALEARVSRQFEEGSSIEAFILDAVGSASAMGLLTRVASGICQQAKDRGWKTGSCLSPGQSYWDVTGHQSIFQVLPTERIGLELLESAFMRPQKSQSAVVPLGPGLKVSGDPGDSSCRYCAATTCPMRREPQLLT